MQDKETTKPLILTKLYMPQVPPQLVARPQLIDCLNQGPKRKVTLVSAPAGYGKSTLVATWLQQLSQSTAWVSLDEQESKLADFLTYLLKNDPDTLHNLADDPDYLPVLRRMRTTLNKWIAQTQDKGFIAEDPAEAQKGAWVVPLWIQLTKGQYDADKYDVFALPVDDEFSQMLS